LDHCFENSYDSNKKDDKKENNDPTLYNNWDNITLFEKDYQTTVKKYITREERIFYKEGHRIKVK